MPALSRTSLCVLWLALFPACDRNFSPTAPIPDGEGLGSVRHWSGAWVLDRVDPAGDCLADYLNAEYAGQRWNFEIGLEVDFAGDRIDLTFHHRGLDSRGFWPLRYAGTVDPGGVVRATLPAETAGLLRQDPWGELCYWEWATQGGQLSASLSADRRSIAGIVVETYRVVAPEERDATFVVESRFSAQSP